MKEHRPDTKTPPDEESVFSRVMNSSVHDGGKPLHDPSKKVAILIVLEEGETLENARGFVSWMHKADVEIESSEIQEFNPDYGSPVIYFP